MEVKIAPQRPPEGAVLNPNLPAEHDDRLIQRELFRDEIESARQAGKQEFTHAVASMMVEGITGENDLSYGDEKVPVARGYLPEIAKDPELSQLFAKNVGAELAKLPSKAPVAR